MVAGLRKFVPTRRWVRWGLAVLIVLCLVGLLGPRLAAPYVRGKLQAMISSKLNAELRMKSLAYLPPFGVRVDDAKLVGREQGGGEVDLLKFARLDLRLAELPFNAGPLVIERIDLRDPQMHFVITEQGLLGMASFPATQPAVPQPQPQPPSPSPPQQQPQTQAAPPTAPPPPSSAPPPSVPTQTKLSDMFRLEHLSISGGKIVLEDRTRPGSVPMVWSDLSATTQTNATSPSAYNFDLKADHKGVAAMTAAGSFDLDALHLTLRDSHLAVAVNPAQPASGMPARVQEVLRDNEVAGKVGLRGTADVSFHDLASATFDATLDVSEAAVRFARTGAPLHGFALRLRSTKRGPADPITFRIERLEASSGESRLALEPKTQPSLILDRRENRWTLADVAGAFDFAGASPPMSMGGRLTFAARGSGPIAPPAGRTRLQAADYEATVVPHDFRIKPPKFPIPMEHIRGGGTGTGAGDARIEFRRGFVSVKNLVARYGDDDFLVRAARIRIPDDPRDLKRSFTVEEIDGRINFRRPNSPYPAKLDKVVAQLRPAGPFEVGGGSFLRVTHNPPNADGTPPAWPRYYEWHFGVSMDDAAISLTDRQITLAQIRGDATVTNQLVEIPRAEFVVLGGTGTFAGKIVPKKPFPVEGGRIALRELDLAQLAREFQPDQPNDKLVGRGFLNLTFAGAPSLDPNVPPANALRGNGEFEIIEGQFWTLPVLGDIFSRTKKGEATNGGNGAATLGEAAGVFHIADRNVVIDNAAVNSPALGLMGSGTVGFDKSIDLRVVAAPLGDWRDHIKRTRIPVFSNVAGELAGGVQRLLGTATSTLLYQFRVTGTAKQPKIETVPAPVLTDPAALLFGRMLDEQRKQHLLESVKTTPPPPPM